MNIFILDKDPILAAQYLCDKHVVKMITESAQILCTVSWLRNSPAIYKPTHIKHPCTIWANQTIDNWKWLYEHGKEIGRQYTIRYGKVHKSELSLNWIQQFAARPMERGLTPFVLCMPAQYKTNDPVESYRKYYLGDKARFAKWKTQTPEWWKYA